MKGPTAEILTIGNELLTGKTLNTNASHICRELSQRGVPVSRITTVGDEVDEIAAALSQSLLRVPRYVFVTGGLGPTFDDVTVQAVARALSRKLVSSRRVLRWMAEAKGIDVSDLTQPLKKMARVAEKADVIRNAVGDAPGLAIREGGTEIFVLPGVPGEMKEILRLHVLERVDRVGRLVRRSFVVENVAEARIAPLIEEVMKANSRVYVKSHVRPMVEGKSTIELEIRMWTGERDESEELVRAHRTLEKALREMGGTIV
ncbi:MAG: competence/damage-inducible protein A [Candidatus Geothermarchaeales archaeon]